MGTGLKFIVDLFFGLIGSKYLLMTTITVLLATYTKVLAKVSGAEEIGTFLIHIFFGAIGAPASIEIILKNFFIVNTPPLFVIITF